MNDTFRIDPKALFADDEESDRKERIQQTERRAAAIKDTSTAGMRSGSDIFRIDPKSLFADDAPAKPARSSAMVDNPFADMENARTATQVTQAPLSPNTQSAPAEAKTTNPLMGAVGRGAELIGSGIEGVARVAEKYGDQLEEAVPLSNLSKEQIRNERQLEPLFKWADGLKNWGKEIGYQPTTMLGDIPENPLKLVPFIAERVVTSTPDMAAAVASAPAYIVSRTNEILNDRLKNDDKRLEDATMGDVATAAGAAVIEATLERFATGKLLKGGPPGKTAVGRVGAEVGIQSGTEALEEGAAYLGGTVGTKKGVDPKELGAQMLEGAIVGGGLGGTVQTAKEILTRGADPESKPTSDRVEPTLATQTPIRITDVSGKQYEGVRLGDGTIRVTDSDGKTVTVPESMAKTIEVLEQPTTVQDGAKSTAVPTAEPTVESAAQPTAVPDVKDSTGVITAGELEDDLKDVDDEAAATIAASQFQESQGEPPDVEPDRQMQIRTKDGANRYVVFDDPLHKVLYQLGAALNQAFTQRPEIQQQVEQLSRFLSKQMGRAEAEVQQLAKQYTDSVKTGAQGVEINGTFQAPRPGSTNPTIQEAVEEMSRDFGLDPDEKVIVEEAPVNTKMKLMAKAIKAIFGTELVWANFGKNREMMTTKGRSMGVFNGYRLGSRDAILVDASNVSFLNTLAHELTHVLETRYPDLYRPLVELAKQKVPQKAQSQFRSNLARAVMSESGSVLSEDLFESELVAEMVGEQGMSPKFWLDVFAAYTDMKMVQQLLDTVTDTLNKALGIVQGPQFVQDRKDMLAVRKAVTEAFQQWAQREQAAKAKPAATTAVNPVANTTALDIPVFNPNGNKQTAKAGRFDRDRLVQSIMKSEIVSATELIAEPDIFRTFQGVSSMIKQAPPIKEEFDSRMQAIVKDLGAELKAGPIKKMPRAFAKAYYDYDGDYNKLKDIVRSTVEGQSVEAMMALVDQILARFPGASVKRNGWAPNALTDPSGYRDVMFAGITVGGMTVELQMNHPIMLAAKEKAHKLYAETETLRRLLSNPAISAGERNAYEQQIYALIQEQKAIYGEAAQRVFDGENPNLARQSDSVIGTPSEVTVDTPKGRGGSSPVIELASQANGMPLGSQDTGTPSTSKNDVPAGKESGTEAISAPKGTLPNSSVAQPSGRAQRAINPLEAAVTQEEADARIARREKRKPGVGAPINERRVLTRGDKRLAIGKITNEDWLNRARSVMTPQEFKDARTWYRQLHDALAPVFGDKAATYALAWLLSQQRASPSKGMMDVLRAADMAAGKPEIKKAGLNQQALIDVLSGRIPSRGIGAKLMDFVDSELGKSTRTYMKDNPAGRQPAAIDVWAERDVGFVDETVLKFIRKEFGDEVADSIELDKTVNGEAQYEYGIDFYNDIVDYLNERDEDGGGWTAREVQAIGWVGMQKAMNIQAEFVRDIIGANTRRISIGLAPGEGSVMAGKLMGKEIPVEVAQREIAYLADLAGLNILQNVNGVGAYLTYVEGAIQIDALASPEAVADFMDMVGFAFQQTEVIGSRFLKSGNRMAVDVMSDALTTVEQSTSFFTEFLKHVPQKKGEPMVQGFQQIVVDGKPGIRFINFSGQWGDEKLLQIQDALNTTSANLGVELDDVVDSNIELLSTKNDWTKDHNGEAYLNSLRERGRLQQAEQLERRYVPSRFDIKGDGTIGFGGKFSRSAEPAYRPSTGGGGSLAEAVSGERVAEQAVTGVHYSKEPNLSSLSGDRYGTGLKGAEAQRLADSRDPRIKKRVYFYLAQPNALPRAESGLGDHVYRQDLPNMLKQGEEMSQLYRAANGDLNAFEASILDAGYDGYSVASLNMAVVMNQDVPVEYLGNRQEAAERIKNPTRGKMSRETLLMASEGRREAPDLFVVGEQPAVLKAVGAGDNTVVIERSKVQKIVRPELFGKLTERTEMKIGDRFVVDRGRLSLTIDELMRLPDEIANPVAIARSASPHDNGGRDNTMVVVTSIVKDGYPVLVVIHPDVNMKRTAMVTDIASAYPKNSTFTNRATGEEVSAADKLFDFKNLLYYNKGKAIALSPQLRVAMPKLLINRPLPKHIKTPSDIKMLAFPKAPPAPVQEMGSLGRVGSFFSRAIPPLQGNRFTLPGFNFGNEVSRGLYNEVGRAAQVQQAVVEQGGIVNDRTDIESAMHRMYGRGAARLEDFRRKVVQPILDKAAKLGVNLDDVSLYLYAQHAPEANRRVAQINPNFPDGGSGMTNAEAVQVMQQFQQDPTMMAKIKQIADALQNITRATQQVLVNGDLVGPAEVAAWNATYKSYVPLKTFEQVNDGGQPTGNGRFDLSNAFSRRRLGRSSKAGAIIENILADHEEAIALVERNNVRKSWLKFILDNKDPQLWQVNRPVLKRSFHKTPIEQVRYQLGIQDDRDTLPVRVGGKVYHMVIEDPLTRQDLEFTSILSGSTPAMKYFFGVWSGFSRYLSKMYTALSPVFVTINATRDTMSAALKSFVTEGVGSAANVLVNIPRSAWAILRAERNGTYSGKMQQLYEQYRADGGKTGFLDLRSIEDRQQEVLDAYKSAQASIANPLTYHRLAMRYLKAAEDLIMDYNAAVEGAARLAAYKDALESGKSREQAAIVSKELTVNFNRRGKWTPLLAPFYLFLNPAVQGAVNTTKTFLLSKKGAAVTAGLVGLGYTVAMMAASAVGDDDEPYWDKDSHRTTKLKNLVFMMPDGDTVTIPLPYGAGMFVNLGYAMHDLQRGKDPWKVAAFMRDSFFVHFSPLGSAENMGTFVAPTVVDPFIVLATGVKDDGMPLMPGDFTGTKPDSERYWNDTRDTMYQHLTTWLNEATGGSAVRSGGIDVSPESLRYLQSYLTGGAGGFVRDVAQSIDTTVNLGADVALDRNQIPFVKSFYRNNTGKPDKQAYYENAKEVQKSADELRLVEELGSEAPEALRKRAYANRGMGELASAMDDYKTALGDLRKEDLQIQNSKMSDAAKYAARQRIAEQQRRLEAEFNRAFYRAQKD